MASRIHALKADSLYFRKKYTIIPLLPTEESHSIPSLGTSICHRCGPKKQFFKNYLTRPWTFRTTILKGKPEAFPTWGASKNISCHKVKNSRLRYNPPRSREFSLYKREKRWKYIMPKAYINMNLQLRIHGLCQQSPQIWLLHKHQYAAIFLIIQNHTVLYGNIKFITESLSHMF